MYEAYLAEELYAGEEEMGPLYQEVLNVFYDKRRAAMEWNVDRPARGMTQKLKKGVQDAQKLMELVKKAARTEERFMVLEIFSGSSMLTQVASKKAGWGAYQPIDVILGEENDMESRANRKRVRDTVKTLKPDLTVITPPCGPWCAWQRMCRDLDNLDEVRKRQLPFWKLAREIWDIQTREGRLCLTEQPDGSEALETIYMVGRELLYRIVVDQCMFGLKDPVSEKWYRKATDLDVNEQAFANGLITYRCNHWQAQSQSA